MSNPTISFCSIVKNESEYIFEMIESIINIADEIIIVDTGSTDNTIEIIESFGIKPYFYKWNDNFAEARNFAISKATKDWIFNIDADERLNISGDFHDFLKVKDHAYLLTTKNMLMNYKEIFYSSCTKLIPNFSGFYFKNEVHEYITREEYHTKSIIKNLELLHLGHNKKNEKKKYRNLNILKNKFPENRIKDSNYYHDKYLIGKEYLALKDFENGISSCLEYINSDFSLGNINKVNAVTDIVKAYYLVNKFDEMAIILDKYKDIAIINPDFCVHYGNYLAIVKNDYQKAIFYYQKAIYFKPSNNIGLGYTNSSIGYYPNLMIGISYLKLEKYHQSINYLKKAIEFNKTAKPLYYLIIAYSYTDRDKSHNLFISNKDLLSDKEIKKISKHLIDNYSN